MKMDVSNPVIKVRNISLSYRQQASLWQRKSYVYQALHDVSFDLNQGDSLAIIGRNGAGKSSLLKLLAGIIQPDQGTVERAGVSAVLMGLNAGYYPELSGRDNVLVAGVLLGYSRKQILVKMDEIVEFSGLKAFIDKPVKTYSDGMKGRLGFSVANILHADVLLIDEVLSVGDKEFRQKSLEVIHNRLTSEQTVVLVSHSEDMIMELCNRVVWIEDGRVHLDGLVEDVIPLYKPAGRS